jgi:Contractile injection system tube protein
MALEPLQLKQAILKEIWWTDKGAPKEKGPSGQDGKQFTVQFNPQTLKINFSNQKAGGEQPKGSSTQFVGKGVTKLTMELWFDISYAQAQGRVTAAADSKTIDVRSLTQQVAYFMQPQAVKGKPNTYVPPGIRINWGTFLFEGVMDSMDETLDLFSTDGLPLRASVSISVSRQEIIFDPKKTATLAGAPGVQPFDVMNAGEPLQKRAGPDWRNAALANGIENPRMMSPGALVNLSAGVSLGGAASLGVDLSAGAQVGVSAGLSAQAGIGISGGAQVSAGALLGTQAGVSAGGGVQLGFAASAAAGASASAQISAGASVQISGGFGGGV